MAASKPKPSNQVVRGPYGNQSLNIIFGEQLKKQLDRENVVEVASRTERYMDDGLLKETFTVSVERLVTEEETGYLPDIRMRNLGGDK